MGNFYDDARFGIEKILTFPGKIDSSAAAYTASPLVFTEDITITEFGIVVTEAYSAGGSVASAQLREGAVVLGNISIPTGSALGTLITAAALTAGNISRADTLTLFSNLSAGAAGECVGFIKYNTRY